jgi:mannosyltransferase
MGAWGIATPSLNQDEVVTMAAATRSAEQLARTVVNVGSVFPAYFLGIHEWAQLAGTSHLALRAPSLLAMIGTASLVSALGQRAHGARAGLLGGVLFALLPSASFYAQTARSNSLAVFFVAASTLLLLVALDKRTTRWWVAYAAAVTLTGWSHLFALSALASHAVVIAVVTRSQRPPVWKSWLASVLAASTIVAPVAALGIAKAAQIDWLPLTSADLLGRSVGALIGAPLVAAVVAALALLGVGRIRDRPTAWLLGSLAFVPFTLLFVAGSFAHVFHDRYVVFTVVAWSVLAGIALARARAPMALAALGLVVVLSASTYVAARQSGSHGDGGLDTVAAEIARAAEPGDAIVYAPMGWLRLGIDYYLPSEGRPRDAYLLVRPSERDTFTAAECADRRRCLDSAPRVWVVCIGAPTLALDCLGVAAADPLRADYVAGPTSVHDTLSVTLFTRKSN